MATTHQMTTRGFALPQKTNGNELPAALINSGLLYKGETYAYTDIEEFIGSKEELEVKFHDGRESLILEIDPDSAPQLHNLPLMVSKHLRQLGLAKYAEGDKDKNTITNAPKYNLRRVPMD